MSEDGWKPRWRHSPLPSYPGIISSWPLGGCHPCHHQHSSLKLSCLPVWQPGLHVRVTMPGFHGEHGQGDESCYLPTGVRMLEQGRDPGPTLSATCSHQLLLASLPLGTNGEFRAGDTSKSLFQTFMSSSNLIGNHGIAQDPTCAPMNANWGPTESHVISVI